MSDTQQSDEFFTHHHNSPANQPSRPELGEESESQSDMLKGLLDIWNFSDSVLIY